MAEARRGLGRGLGALIPDSAPEALGTDLATYVEVRPDDVVPNHRQPRQIFEPEALAELVHSIREVGLLQPIVIRRRADATDGGASYELVAGERRWRASQQAGLIAIPAIVRDTADDDMLREALLENLHRAQLNPLEEAAAYQQLLADFGGTQEELAQRLGRSRPQVANTLRLLKLPPPVQRRVAAGVISAGHARALLSLDDAASMDALAERIVKEGLSVRTVEEIVLVGDDGERTRKRTPRPRNGAAADVAEATADISGRLSDALDTRVRVEGARTASSKGRVVIEFADLEDLRRVCDTIISG
jgi:ParB family transcriptional regulator, chromosome partitioning protein